MVVGRCVLERLAAVKRFFEWAVDQRVYGLKVSPCAGLKASRIIGANVKRDHVLNDAELRALWRAADRVGYPAGPVYKLLILNALRLNEAAGAARPEFDMPKKTWEIPATRMKGKNGTAQAHVVPLTDDTLAVLKSLPTFTKGKFLFSTTYGQKPAWVGSKVKEEIDALMLDELRKEDRAAELRPWKNHDIRRTVGSWLSRLKIAEEVREAVLAHVRPGVKGVYDQYEY